MKIINSMHDSLRTALNKTSKIDGRILVLAILFVYFSLLFVFMLSIGWYKAWERFGVAPLFPQFADLRVVLAGFECTRLGYDVQVIHNPCDPWSRPFAYPRFWLALTPLGLDQRHTIFLGAVLVLLFYFATFKIMGKLNYYEALVYSLILCSPSVMWIVERGNVDIIIYFFSLISLIIISNNQKLIYRFFGYALVLLTAFLKLFPIFGLAILFKEKRKYFFILLAILVTPFTIYWLSNLEELRSISWGLNAYETWHSFGFKVLFLKSKDYLVDPNIISGKQAITTLIIGAIIGLISFLMIYKLIIKVFQELNQWLNHNFQSDSTLNDNDLANSNYIDSFRLGSSLYVGSFIMGTVYDYKLSFMLFAIPQILDWIKSSSKLSFASSIALLGIVATLYLSPSSVFNLDEIVNWFLVVFFVYTLSVSLPHWLKLSIHSIVRSSIKSV